MNRIIEENPNLKNRKINLFQINGKLILDQVNVP